MVAKDLVGFRAAVYSSMRCYLNSALLNGQLRSWSPDAIVSTDCGAINNLLGPPVNAPDPVHAVGWAFMNGTWCRLLDSWRVKTEKTAKKRRKKRQKWARYSHLKRVRVADLFLMDRYIEGTGCAPTFLPPVL